MKPCVSIIVPVYNVEKYLEKCIKSILNQTFTDFEVILVDDGSPDNCGKICDEYAEKDNRVKVIHKENGGVSAARNTGLDAATGEYVMFVDSDDYINNNMLEKMLNMYNPSVDLVVSSVKMITVNEGREDLFVMDNKTYEKNCLLTDFFLKKFPIICLSGPWCKLFRMDIINSNKMKFNTSMSLSEDILFNLNYLEKCERSIVSVSDCFYNYVREREDSLFSKFRITNHTDIKTVFEKKMQLADKFNLGNKVKAELTKTYMNRCISNILKASNTSDEKTANAYMALLAGDTFFIKNHKFLKSNFKNYLIAKLVVSKKFALILKIIKIRNFSRRK